MVDKIFSALITPMDKNERVNYKALEQIVELQLQEGVEGFYCCGSSGEGLLLSLEEREKILETIVKQVKGRVEIIAHVGTIYTKDVIRLAKHAKSIGANAISMIPPYYYNFTMDEIITYYEEVIENVPGIPIIIYNIPQFTGVEFSKKNAKKLFDNPAIIGVKHTSNNLYSMERIRSDYSDKLIFNGFDEQFLGALSMGAEATIGTTVNLFAPLFIEIRRLYHAGEMRKAFELQSDLNNKIEKMIEVGIFNAVKYALSVKGIECGQCRSPFKVLSEREKSIIKELI